MDSVDYPPPSSPSTPPPSTPPVPTQTIRTPVGPRASAPAAAPDKTLVPTALVRYRLSQKDADEINRRVDVFIHKGNVATLGDVLPMVVTKVTPPPEPAKDAPPPAVAPVGTVNGQVFVDGDSVLWVQGVLEGAKPGMFAA